MTRTQQLERALLALYLAGEQSAVSGYETCTYPGSIFDDKIWREEDPEGFALMRQARRLLGLRPFRHRDTKNFGHADDRLADFRAKAGRK